MKVSVTVSLKEGILDPQGKAVEHALQSLGFNSVKGVRIGKSIEIEMDGSGNQKEAVKDMCLKLLSNPVTENFKINAEPNK